MSRTAPTITPPTAGIDLPTTKSNILAAIVAVLNATWPIFAQTYDLSLSNGTKTKLDPLNIAGLFSVSGGPCPVACGKAAVNTITGLSTATIAAPPSSVIAVRGCDFPALALTAPVTFSDLNVAGAVNWELLGLARASPDVLLTWKGVRGTINVLVPLVAVPNTANVTTAFQNITVQIVLDVTALEAVDGTTGLSPSLTLALVNDALRGGASTFLQRLADTHLSALLEKDLQQFFLANSWTDITFSRSWVSGAMSGVVSTPSDCALIGKGAAAFPTPCDPCDTCCLCASQGNCGSAACASECGACMPKACKKQIAVPVPLVAVASGVSALAALLLVLIAWLLVLGAVATAHGATGALSKLKLQRSQTKSQSQTKNQSQSQTKTTAKAAAQTAAAKTN